MHHANDNADPTRFAAEARVTSLLAARYLGQLCKHFAHRVPVERAPAAARIRLPNGTCRLRAEAGVLTLRVQSAGEDELRAVVQVVTEHLARFAFRDRPAIEWSFASEAAAGAAQSRVAKPA
jgi:hypothetical protein